MPVPVSDYPEVPQQFSMSEPLRQTHYLCDGKLLQWQGAEQEVISPVPMLRDGGEKSLLVGWYPLLTSSEASEVLAAACNAYDYGRGQWPTMTVEERIRCIDNFASRMSEQRSRIVTLLMWEIGKSLPDAEKEFDRTIDYINDTIDALKDLDRVSSRFVIEEKVIAQIKRAPLGVVLCMGPYNYPLNETFTTLIPALIMGNTVIFKPPRYGVLLHQPLLQAFAECFPPGVVNTVYGDGQQVIGPLMTSGRIDVLAFIGSSRVADILKHQHPKPHRLRSVLGLEAKNAAIILPDADLDATVNECVLGSLSYNGQRCTALKIIFVHRDIRQAFLDRFCHRVNELLMGLPWEKGVTITPLPEQGKINFLLGLIEDATDKGANIINEGGGAVERNMMHPAVVFPVSGGMRLYEEEQFGPVVPVAEYTDLQEPMDYLTESAYGQQVSLFGNDPEQIARLIDPLVNQVCRVNINSQCQRGPDTFPFTGRKDSAEGTLSVADALRAFSIRSLVAAKETEGNRRIIKSVVSGRMSRFLSTDFIL